MEFRSLNEGDSWLSIPTDKVIGSVSTTEELKTAITKLNAAGFAQDQVSVLCGKEGASRLDVTGAQHGLMGRLYRFVEEFGDMDLKLLKDYQEELLGGHFVVAVDVKDEDERKRVTGFLVSHGGHRVNFFGRWEIENLG